jgi:hypothetical protein
MKNFENRNIMRENLKKQKLTISNNPHDKDIFCGTEYAGVWSYVNTPKPGKEAFTPVQVDLIRKYDY